MSYQVGLFCYATPVEAGAATCGRYDPVSSVTSGGDQVMTVSCEGVNSDTGALLLKVASTPTNGSASTYRTVEQIPVFAPCQQADLMAAGMEIFWALVGLIVVPYCLYKFFMRLIDYRNSHRGNDNA
ncbi:MAG: hypothetical protein Q7T66_10375 [Herminiimonas sp.]|uniref:hypothetical protein n=1 Tax=Herminiimonas sp. TaxID=1926289 RepID=UPI00271BBD10|nr:hypothetical protein [Herminiimonas sp.]MDO9421058.1 hypothetical protein [Herminiimonas sp.]